MLRAIIIMKNYIQKSKYTTSYLPTTRKKNTLDFNLDNVDYADIIGTQDTPEATKSC